MPLPRTSQPPQLLLILLFLLTALSSRAQQRRRLTAGWEFVRQDLGGVWEAVRPVVAGNPESVPLWQAVTLPHCFNARDAVDPDVNYYQGPGWYRIQLAVQNPYPGGHTRLHFEGAGQKTEVYLNTTKVGSHVGGYDEWTVDVTQAVADFQQIEAFQKQFKGKIPLSIRCDNSRDLEMIPSDLSDFNIYGGLYRYVNLEYLPAVALEHLSAKAEVDPAGKNGLLTLKATFLENTPAAADTKVTVRLLDPLGKAVGKYEGTLSVKAGELDLHQFKVKSPRLWSPDRPQLYTVEVTVGTGPQAFRQTEKVGFRHSEFVEHGPYRLNGQRLLLRGTHRHEDHAGVAAAMTEPQIRQEMRLMKQMGVNFIRLGHYQQSRIVLNLCDSLGILVWEEIPWCRGGLGGPVYQAQARRMLTNMVQQHYNHPAVIIWGLGNENDWPGDFPEFDKERIRAFMKSLNDLAHQLDASRYTAIRRCDFCKDIPDVYSPSIWAGWYRGIYTDYKAATEEEFKGVKRFLHVEWGGDSHAGRHAENPDNALAKITAGRGADERAGDASLFGGSARVSKDGDWSETYLCNLVDWHLKEQETMPWLSGAAYWPFKDFSTPVRPDNPIPYMNQKGVVERDFTKKEAYYVFQSYWTTAPMAHLYGHSWPVRWGEAGELKMVKVYSNCAQAELFVNGKSYGTRQRNSQDFPAAGLHWNVPFAAGPNEVRVLARQGRQTVEDRISFQYETRKWGKPTRLTLTKTAEANGLTTVEVKLFDAQGVQCLDAANWVEFSLAGAGRLLDDLGTSSGARKVQAYNGRAIIRLEAQAGQSVVAVQSPGLEAVLLPL
ncbi:glycoside hydrolase family 2 TIM barrel-domain containing protein [Hymenobacter convexus]|uniref:glycoside hydrolase family 2 TIM barrel-domain containing protein n=1 Tax=Hymenobacter sp. CA1UV-4 TaxID=3063782 RepID=UPI002712FEFE|nr:glycoside hydrolase family 2 TIM barrel-domain containing protein [Hymenobacter sp. CA1UV-4]MDO7851609.1 glycoside hydrolase family 2 TIM barrel-domain containing protein [Hymenobacter sp. CA1UV-4]